MASVHRHPRSDTFQVMFRYAGTQFQKSLKTKDRAEAERRKAAIETILDELERGRKVLPPGADLWQFLLSDGQRAQKPEAPAVVSLDLLFTRYEQEMPPGTMEASSLATIRIHRGHLFRHLGCREPVQSVTTTTLQGYVNARAREEYRGKLISPRTIRKEVTTLRSVWNWGKERGLVAGDAPVRGLRFGKDSVKPPFMTWEEVERRVGRGGLGVREAKALWDALFLDAARIAACLEHVRVAPGPPFVYPMFVFVAHTGVRRSEVIRSRVEDVDLTARRVTVRERKRDRTKTETVRHVEMSPRLVEVMTDWLGRHPGGPFTFCQSEVVARSRTRSPTTGHKSGKARPKTKAGRNATVRGRAERPAFAPLTKHEATHYFKKALAGSPWKVVRGFHVFRHSFASNMARAGVSPQVIDGFMGHQTAEMRDRYQHLFPQERESAIARVFGKW